MFLAFTRRTHRYLKWSCTAVVLAVLSLGSATSLAQGKGMQHIKFRKVIDLSHVITPNIPLWPGDPAVEFTPVANFDTDGYYLRSFRIGEHSATHMNAPNSFHADGIGIDQYEPESLVDRKSTRLNSSHVKISYAVF